MRVTFLSFCWYFLVRAEIIPLAIAPVIDAAPNAVLTGIQMNVANVATLDIPMATLSENISETSEEFHYDYFKLEDGELYYRGKRKPLTTKGVLKLVEMLTDILGKGRLRNLGFDILRAKVTARPAVMLNKVAEELPPESDITWADDIELQEIAEKALKSTENLILHLNDQQSQTDDVF